MTNAEIERLALLIEECGEVIQAATKVLRHGWDSYNPLDLGSPENRHALERELGHVQHAVDLLCTNSDCWPGNIQRARDEKARTVGQWLHFQPERAHDRR